jgi:tRNA wybutosine-synthesizing protein 1
LSSPLPPSSSYTNLFCSAAPARAPTTTPTLLYTSVTGTSKALATRLSARLTADAGVTVRAGSSSDFRAGALLLSGLRFAVFGVGSRAYGETFIAAAKSFSQWLRALGAAEVVPLGEGDVDGGDLEAMFEE